MKKRIIKEGLYVHIPFCDNICTYCNFAKVIFSKQYSQKYLLAVKEELHKYDNFSFLSIYIGGGTPTSLDPEDLDFLFQILLPYCVENSFFTIETNPNLSDEKIAVLKKYHVNRISIGIQSFNNNILKIINRKSDYKEVQTLIKKLNDNGINDINLDLIYGFKEQTLDELKKDLDLFTSLPITHISTYCLQLEEGTILSYQKYSSLNEEEVSAQYNFIRNYLSNKGFYRYEVSNFAKPNYESKHNLIYWNNHEYGGVGLNASSYIDHVRFTNTKSLTEYLQGKYHSYQEVLSFEDEEFYFIMLGLRKEKGLSLIEYQQIFNYDFLKKYHDKIQILLEQKDLLIENNYLKLHPKNFFILDYFLRKILF